MSKVSRLSIRIRPKSKNGPKSTISSSPVTQLESKSPNFWVTSWLRWVSIPSFWLKEKKLSQKLMNWNTLLSSNPRKLLAWVLQLEMSIKMKIKSDKMWLWLSTIWYPWWRRDGKTLELCILKPQWVEPIESLVDHLTYLNPYLFYLFTRQIYLIIRKTAIYNFC